MMSTFPIKTKYLNEEVSILLGRYQDKSIAMQLVTANGEPASTSTVCLAGTGEIPADGHVFIKDWSENEGMLQGLIDAGIIGQPKRTITVGSYTALAYECELLISPDDSRARLL